MVERSLSRDSLTSRKTAPAQPIGLQDVALMAYVKGSALAEDVTTGDLLLAHEVPLLELRQ